MAGPLQQAMLMIGGGGLTVCTETGHAAAFLARTSGLDATHTTAYTNLLNGLETDGLSCKLDLLHIYATQNSATALLNLVQNKYNGVINGAPTFTADRGFTGVDSSSTVYIDTGYNPVTVVTSGYPTQYAVNNAHISVWQLNNVTSAGPQFGSSNATVAQGVLADFFDAAFIETKLTGTNYGVYRLNQQLNQASYGTAHADPRAHWMVTRSASGTGQPYFNGVSEFGITASSGVPNLNFYSLAGNMAGVAMGSQGQIAMVSAGSGFTPTQAVNFYNRLRTYMTAVGVP